ncbi:hypothetical protein DACRYDRAFT_24162 [Dacryopinax primogenitus]|uniref:Mucoidy inhibitor A n=1 Tax=Dacryopinax primogenitus (strain DJM 731) TaxID=1858805 RepID=M5FT02_DACPD|nr:uncharacterized protein DACRYDRAFT_24162 [Dacryopinax primogenitus]EJT99103.1 hypothetical protein DACRYDRAFT_24162 [Dacryopinax primogenitus]
MSHNINIDASEHPVTAVTVYQQRAEVLRDFKVELVTGQSEVQISKLPTCMDESSLRVDGIGNAVIFDVIYERLSPKLTVPKASSEKVAALEIEEATLRRELKVLTIQTSILGDFSKSLTAKDVNPSQLVEFMGILEDKGTSLEEMREKTHKRLQEVQLEIAVERNGQIPSEEARKLATKVTVIVLAEQAGPAELTVKYVVSNADWEPLYDLRATVNSSSKGENTTSISLNYRASITQTTGEEWKDVNLILSTSSPLTGTDIPELQPQRICAVPEFMPKSKYKRRSAVLKTAAIPPPPPMPAAAMPRNDLYRSARMCDLEEDMLEYEESLPPPLMGARRTEAKEGALSTSFHIEGLSNIPSDGTTHKVVISVLDLTAKLEWIAVPRLNTSAFLQCQITNSSTYVLLSGPSNVFLDGSFVAKSTIPYVSPQDTFACSVGVDPSVRITYPPQSKKARKQGTGNFLSSSKQDITLFTQHISIKTTRTSEVKLLVRDLVPVSEDQKFKISVLEPKGLGDAKAGEEIKLEQYVFCYWARKDWETNDKSTVNASSLSKAVHKSSQNDAPDGQVEWVLKLAPGTSKDLTVSWEIAAPQGEKWQMR